MEQPGADVADIKDVRKLVTLLVAANALTPDGRKLLDALVKALPKGVSEEALAKQLRLTDWSSNLNSSVRQAVARLRDGLAEFFDYGDGATSDLRLGIPRGSPYRVEIVANVRHLRRTERFWDAHFRNHAANVIVYTEPLFFLDKAARTYIRYLDINDPANIPSGHPACGLIPCYHYQSSGETLAQRSLRKWFESQSENIEVKLSRESIPTEIWSDNIIALGNKRTNGFLKSLQKDLPMVLEGDRVVVAGEENPYYDFGGSEAQSTDEIFVVVTRRASITRNRCATLIAANNGRGIEKTIDFLLDETTLERLFSQMEWDIEKSIPERFQILFRVQLIDFHLAVGEAEYVRHVVF